jgi:DNA-binding LacI/PurR family transcriptional regulator
MHDNQFFTPLMAGIEDVVSEHGFNLLIASRSNEPQSDFEARLGVHNTDGMLAFADSLNDEQIALLYRRQHPIVLIHKTPAKGLDIPFVTVENKAATHELVSHLIAVHDCRRILFMRGPEEQEDSYWREIGYKSALAEHGIVYDEALSICGFFDRDIAHDALLSFLADADHAPFDAIFTGDDEAAIGVYEALSETGLRIPEDVKVVGFDDSSLAPFLTPPLTTVRAPTEEVGRSAAQQLFHLLEGKSVQPEIIHRTEIVIRRSCGCEDHNGHK